MRTASKIASLVVLTALLACSPSQDVGQPAAAVDPLPSWNDGNARRAILDFVARVTDPANPDFVSEAVYAFAWLDWKKEGPTVLDITPKLRGKHAA
jgi:hypothetical protein